MVKLFVHGVMLLILAAAEFFRLTDFFKIQAGSVEAGAASAVVSVVVVLYLALFRMKAASIFATFICVLLSLASFLRPYEELQFSTVKQVTDITEKTLPLPVWDPRKFRSGEETYKASFDAETDRIKRHNERVEKIYSVRESKNLRLSEIVVFILGALTLGLCVPVLTFTVSHKLADDIKEYRDYKGMAKIKEAVDSLNLKDFGFAVPEKPQSKTMLEEIQKETLENETSPETKAPFIPRNWKRHPPRPQEVDKK